MCRILRLLSLPVFLGIVTACAAPPRLMGNPETPYPRAAPPVVGDIVHLPTGATVTMAQMLNVVGDARIVYVGETHDNPASHRLQMQILRALAQRYPGGVAVGMEMFTASQQPILDEWVAGKLDEKSFLKKSRWFDNWTMDFGYYRDLLNFVRENRIPLIALNADKKLVEAVRNAPLDQLSADQRARLPEMDLNDPYLRAMALEISGQSSHAALNIEGFIRAQILRDETMAAAIADYLRSPAGADKHLLVFAGGDHVTHGVGIPRRAFRRYPASYALVCGEEINVGADKQDRLMDLDLPRFPMTPFHFVTYLEYEALPENGVKLGVMFEQAPDRKGLLVKKVMPGSAGERAGLQAGDVLLDFDGEPLTDGFDLIYAVKQKKPGDKGVVRIERNGQEQSVEVLFEAGEKERH